MSLPQLKDLVLKDTPFAELMNKRIYNVLLIATKYDAFMLEDDGRIDEQIFNDLGRYGIIPNKTYLTKHIPYEQIPGQYLSAFALGLFDGDGNFYCSKDFSSDITFGFTAYSEEIVKDFKQLINLLLNKNTNNRVYFTSAWHTQWRGRLQVLDILNILYKNCPRFLKRKHELYLALKNSLN